MTPKEIAAELRRLDKQWEQAGTDGERARPRQKAMADFVSENLEQILTKLES